MNPMAWVVDALKVHPEPVSLPEALEDANRMQLAEARSRLAQIAQVAGELRRLVDRSLAAQLAGGAFRYGDDIYRPAGRGAAKVIDADMWWHYLSIGLDSLDGSARKGLLAALYPVNALRLTGLKIMAAAIGIEEQALRDTFIHYEEPTSPLSVMPISKSPKWTQKLDEGQFSGEKNNE